MVSRPQSRSEAAKNLGRVHDFDEFGKLMTGWDGSFTQLSRGRFEGSMQVVQGSEIQVHLATGNQEIQVRGKEKSNTCMLTLVQPGSEGCLWQNRRAPAGSIIVRGDDIQIDHRTCRNSANLSLAIQEKTLGMAARAVGFDLGYLGWKVVRPDPKQYQALEFALRSFLIPSTNSKEKSRKESLCIAAAVESLATAFKTGWYNPNISARAKIRRMAEDRMWNELTGGLVEAELVEDIGVSGRTLRLAFTEHYGFGPMDYYRTLRLNAARHALKEADPKSISIARLAESFGFFHAGKFSGFYRRIFGELPAKFRKTPQTGSQTKANFLDKLVRV